MEVIPQAVVALNFGYDIMGAMFTLAERFSVLSTTYEDNGSISVRVRLPEREVEEFTEEIRGVSRGGATMEVIGDDEFGEEEEE
mmetsp:Transcript_22084/g.54664  ORF Transcript_22084/g.54664 Transcript_22084/m.54664 type:complete len:84 (-) Transcript_22084:572-823(-)